MKPYRPQKALFYFLFLIVSAPFIQQSLHLFHPEKLKGAIAPIPDNDFSPEGWWAGTYQSHKDSFLNANTGFRPDLVRLNNELDFDVFHLTHANGVLVGKNNMLYEQFYLDEYAGLDYLGDVELRHEVVMLKKVQDTLERMGKTFVMVLASTKADAFPDQMPEHYRSLGQGKNRNYTQFKALSDSVRLNLLDCNAWLCKMKDTCRYPLFTRQGVHWTVLGSFLACDTLSRYIGALRHISTPHIVIDSVVKTTEPRRTDNDLVEGLNLIYKPDIDTFAYPVLHYVCDTNYQKLNGIYIGDSFLWTIKDDGLMWFLNKDWEIWYYFYNVWTQNMLSGQEPSVTLDHYDWKTKLMTTDCVVAMYTPANIKGFAYRGALVYSLYQYFYPGQELVN